MADNKNDITIRMTAEDEATLKIEKTRAQIRGLQGDLAKMGGGTQASIGRSDSFLEGIHSQLGSGRMIGKVLGGGIVGFGGGMLADMTGKMKDFNEQLQKGQLDAAGVAVKLGESLPIIGGFVAAGQNIREMLLGEKAEIDRINEATADQDRLYEQRKKDIESIRQAQKGSADAVSLMRRQYELVGASIHDATRKQIELNAAQKAKAIQDKQQADDKAREAAKNTELEKLYKERSDEAGKSRGLLGTAWALLKNGAQMNVNDMLHPLDSVSTVINTGSPDENRIARVTENIRRVRKDADKEEQGRAKENAKVLEEIERERQNAQYAANHKFLEDMRQDRIDHEKKMMDIVRGDEDARMKYESQIRLQALTDQGRDTEASIEETRQKYREQRQALIDGLKASQQAVEDAQKEFDKATGMEDRERARKKLQDRRAEFYTMHLTASQQSSRLDVQEKRDVNRAGQRGNLSAGDFLFQQNIAALREESALGDKQAAKAAQRLQIEREFLDVRKKLAALADDETLSENERNQARTQLARLGGREKAALLGVGREDYKLAVSAQSQEAGGLTGIGMALKERNVLARPGGDPAEKTAKATEEISRNAKLTLTAIGDLIRAVQQQGVGTFGG